jgi:NO-binding membrane sensor protein with MHYT domain
MEALAMLGAALFPICLLPVGVAAVALSAGALITRNSFRSRSLPRILAACVLVAGIAIICYAAMQWFPS